MSEVYIELGKEEEARTHTAEVLKLDPNSHWSEPANPASMDIKTWPTWNVDSTPFARLGYPNINSKRR
jgi:hypothetical protein